MKKITVFYNFVDFERGAFGPHNLSCYEFLGIVVCKEDEFMMLMKMLADKRRYKVNIKSVETR